MLMANEAPAFQSITVSSLRWYRRTERKDVSGAYPKILDAHVGIGLLLVLTIGFLPSGGRMDSALFCVP
jgi:hypothetical protein